MARILTVTPNPAVDVTYTVERQLLGETVRVSDVQRRPGGKGLNVARVLHALGRTVTAVHPLGGDAGRWIESALVRDGLPATTCAISGETRTTVAVVDGVLHPTLLAEPGPALSEREWQALTETITVSLEPGDWVVVAGSFPPATPPSRLADLIADVHAREAHVLVDTSGPLLRAAADAGADVVKANEHEVLDATAEADPARALARLGRAGSTVMMSQGSDGALLRQTDGRVHERAALPGVTGNPTGAGDAATAGLVAALAEGADADTALAWAAVMGAAAVMNRVAGEIDLALLPELCARAGIPLAALLPPPPHERTSA